MESCKPSFGTLKCRDWGFVQRPAHAPQGVREQHYIRRPLDLLRMWHVKIEAWKLKQAGI
jgi:hypothetical protein